MPRLLVSWRSTRWILSWPPSSVTNGRSRNISMNTCEMNITPFTSCSGARGTKVWVKMCPKGKEIMKNTLRDDFGVCIVKKGTFDWFSEACCTKQLACSALRPDYFGGNFQMSAIWSFRHIPVRPDYIDDIFQMNAFLMFYQFRCEFLR